MSVSPLHQEILNQIKLAAPVNVDQQINIRYHGNNHYFYGMRVPPKRALVRDFLKQHKELSSQKFFTLITDLISSESFEEKTIAGHLIETAKHHRANIDLQNLDRWLDHLEGWAEIDCLCQSAFTAEEVLSNWSQWQPLLEKFATDKNISKRRASLVLLIKAIGSSTDHRLADLAFKNITILQNEKDILITKAISWLLRTLIKNHQSRVEEYLEKNKELLPKIAIRETAVKLKHGIKNYRV
jgi:3-methyladenine DNA glycosylase AlkD